MILGMVLASFMYLFIDDFFSNNQLNDWAWKVIYIVLFLITATLSILLKLKDKSICIDLYLLDNFNEEITFNKVQRFFLINIYNLPFSSSWYRVEKYSYQPHWEAT